MCSPLHSTAAILSLCFLAMSFVDTSALYHMIRAQSVIKLYVIYNMLDVRKLVLINSLHLRWSVYIYIAYS